MGIDAVMFVRVKGRDNWLAPANELKTACELASALGPSKFLITKPRDGSAPKYIGDGHHALSIVRPIKDKEQAEWYGLDDSCIGKTIISQDGPDIIADEDEQFIKVHLWSRYYGDGYERGDWPTLLMVAEWLERKFPAGEVWYGGDSSGVCAEHLTKEKREVLTALYLDSGTTNYRGYFGSFRGDKSPVCGCCEQPMYSSGGGSNYSFYSCYSCENKAISNSTKTMWLERGEDFFKASEKFMEAA